MGSPQEAGGEGQLGTSKACCSCIDSLQKRRGLFIPSAFHTSVMAHCWKKSIPVSGEYVVYRVQSTRIAADYGQWPGVSDSRCLVSLCFFFSRSPDAAADFRRVSRMTGIWWDAQNEAGSSRTLRPLGVMYRVHTGTEYLPRYLEVCTFDQGVRGAGYTSHRVCQSSIVKLPPFLLRTEHQ